MSNGIYDNHVVGGANDGNTTDWSEIMFGGTTDGVDALLYNVAIIDPGTTDQDCETNGDNCAVIEVRSPQQTTTIERTTIAYRSSTTPSFPDVIRQASGQSSDEVYIDGLLIAHHTGGPTGNSYRATSDVMNLWTLSNLCFFDNGGTPVEAPEALPPSTSLDGKPGFRDREDGDFSLPPGGIMKMRDCGHRPGPTGPGVTLKQWYHRAWGLELEFYGKDIWTFTGTAVGGYTIDFTVDGVALQISTVAGQTGGEIAQAVADEINDDPTLQVLGTTAWTDGNQLNTNGAFTDITINDPGVDPKPVPTLSDLGLVLLPLLLMVVAARAAARGADRR